jgi:glyoxylase-like metal-dependent hydrolase (beta-lactamase superfamily II)
MAAFICTACGTQYSPSETPPQQCDICAEERQYVPLGGQSWSTLAKLAESRFNAFRQHAPDLIGLGTEPRFAIGQRAILLRTPAGNVLWDCISFLDAATVTLIKALGGIQAIAISHPHFYTTMVEWSRAFGDAPIHLHAADRAWVRRPDPAIKFWDGDTLPLIADVTLIRGGGHFPGGTMLHWAKGAQGRGVVLCSDIATVTQDRKFLTFMRSYPNQIPLSARGVRAIAASLAPFAFDAMYGHYFDRVIATDAKRILKDSVERYVAAVGGAYDET